MSEWVCYVVGLFDAGTNQLVDGRPTMYKGSTDDIRNRLRQHNDIIAGGARYTTLRVRGRQHERVWKVVCLVRGFTSETHVRQFEICIKVRHMRSRRKRVEHSLWAKLDRVQVPSAIRHVLQTLACRPKWCIRGPNVSDLRLRLELWQPDLIRSTGMKGFLDMVTTLDTIHGYEEVSCERQEELLKLDDMPRAKPWVSLPWRVAAPVAVTSQSQSRSRT